MIEEERHIEWCLIFNKEDEICLLIDLIDNNKFIHSCDID